MPFESLSSLQNARTSLPKHCLKHNRSVATAADLLPKRKYGTSTLKAFHPTQDPEPIHRPIMPSPPDKPHTHAHARGPGNHNDRLRPVAQAHHPVNLPIVPNRPQLRNLSSYVVRDTIQHYRDRVKKQVAAIRAARKDLNEYREKMSALERQIQRFSEHQVLYGEICSRCERELDEREAARQQREMMENEAQRRAAAERERARGNRRA
jgi:hypothetical protein